MKIPDQILSELPADVDAAQVEQALADARNVNLNIEEHGDWLYAWDRDTNNFLAQGANVQELFQRLYDITKEGDSVVYRCHPEFGGDIIKRRGLTEAQ